MTGPSGLVFRDAVRRLRQSELCHELLVDLVSVLRAADRQVPSALMRALLSAATLECALEDAVDPPATLAAPVTDAIARAAVLGRAEGLSPLLTQVDHLRAPRMLQASRPEGFAYHALDPLAFGRAAAAWVGEGPVVVIGIRTIGTALSAAAAAALDVYGHPVRRFTVRPFADSTGPKMQPTDPQGRLWRRAAAQGATFLVVDEGPGLSGSSFLAVVEALEALSIPRQQIAVFGTRAVDPHALAPEAVSRWRGFRFGFWDPGESWRASDEQDLSGGRWRALLVDDPRRYPASWPSMERRKALSADGRELRKFVGLGRHGDGAYARAERLGEVGWSPLPLAPPDPDGYLRLRFVAGRPMSARARSPELAAQIGLYLAERAAMFPADGADEGAFAEMVAHNVRSSVRQQIPDTVPCWQRVTVVDGRLDPHEWITTDRGLLLKTDSHDHGDDHFFPGPTDVAWDLAGAAVEWQLDGTEREALVDSYVSSSGEDPRERLPYFEVAYTAFRSRYCAVALPACGREEQGRWRRALHYYVRALRRALQAWRAPAEQPVEAQMPAG